MPIQLMSPPCLPVSKMKQGMAVHNTALGHHRLPVALDSSCVGKPRPRAALGQNLPTPLHPPAAAHPADPPCKIGVSEDSPTRDPSPSINLLGGWKGAGLSWELSAAGERKAPWCCPACCCAHISQVSLRYREEKKEFLDGTLFGVGLFCFQMCFLFEGGKRGCCLFLWSSGKVVAQETGSFAFPQALLKSQQVLIMLRIYGGEAHGEKEGVWTFF